VWPSSGAPPLFVVYLGQLTVNKGNIVELWGRVYGRYTYDTAEGGKATLPRVDARFVEVEQPTPLVEWKGFRLWDRGMVYESNDTWVRLLFATNDVYKLSLVDPGGVVTHSRYIEPGETLAFLHVGYEPPSPGRYRLVVEDVGGNKFDYSMDFAGPALYITGLEVEGWTRSHSTGTYTIECLHISVVNKGELPAWPEDLRITIDGRTTVTRTVGGRIWPSEHEDRLDVCGGQDGYSGLVYGLAPGKHEIALVLRGANFEPAGYVTTLSTPPPSEVTPSA